MGRQFAYNEGPRSNPYLRAEPKMSVFENELFSGHFFLRAIYIFLGEKMFLPSQENSGEFGGFISNWKRRSKTLKSSEYLLFWVKNERNIFCVVLTDQVK